MNVKHLTHYDFDAVACHVAVKKFLGHSSNLEVIPTGYAKMPEKLEKTLKNLETETSFFVTDLDLSIDQINNICDHRLVKRLVYCDHHPKSKEWIDWSLSTEVSRKAHLYFDLDKCGAQITYDVLSKAFKTSDLGVAELARIANVYDLWNTNHPDFDFSTGINSLFWELGFWKFAKYMENGFRLGKSAKAIIEKKIQERDEYLKETLENFTMTTETKDGKIIALVVNPKALFQNDFKHLNPQFDACIIYGGSPEGGQKWSLRSSDDLVSKGIDLGTFAELISKKHEDIDGGGHPAASGISINNLDIRSSAELLVDELRAYIDSTLNISE